jgi:hypothetical protein
MKKKFQFVLGSIFLCVNLGAQSFPLQSFYRSNWQLVNPAAVDRMLYFQEGGNNGIYGSSLALGSRTQWVGSAIEKPPTTGYFSMEFWPEKGFVVKKNRFGGQLYYHTFGEQSVIGLHGNYTFKLLKGNRQSSLLIGLNPGVQIMAVNRSNLHFATGGDALESAQLSQITWNLSSAGMFYSHKMRGSRNKNYYLGVSTPPGIIREQLKSSSLQQFSHSPIYFLGGIYLGQGSSRSPKKLDIEVSSLCRYLPKYSFVGNGNLYSEKTVSGELNVRAYLGSGIHKTFWFGAGLGTNSSFSTELGFNMINEPKATNGRVLRIALAYNQSYGEFMRAPSFELGLFYAKFNQASVR